MTTFTNKIFSVYHINIVMLKSDQAGTAVLLSNKRQSPVVQHVEEMVVFNKAIDQFIWPCFDIVLDTIFLQVFPEFLFVSAWFSV